ncbi:hypothetical protein D3C81_1932440 [compost metagenome]
MTGALAAEADGAAAAGDPLLSAAFCEPPHAEMDMARTRVLAKVQVTLDNGFLNSNPPLMNHGLLQL